MRKNKIIFAEIISSLAKILDGDKNQLNVGINNIFTFLTNILDTENIELLISNYNHYQIIKSIGIPISLIDENTAQVLIDNLKKNDLDLIYLEPQLYSNLYSIIGINNPQDQIYIAPLNDKPIGFIKITLKNGTQKIQEEDKILTINLCGILSKILKKIVDFPSLHNNPKSSITNEIFRTITENSQIGIIIVNQEGNIIFINEAISRIIGLNKEEILNQQYTSFRYSLEPNSRNSESNFKKFKSAFNEAFISSESDLLNRQFECNIVDINNKIKFIAEYNYIIKDKSEKLFISIIYDISELKQAEQALIESERRYKLIADKTTDLIILHTRNGLINYISQSCYNLTGFHQEELLYENLFDKLLHSNSEKFKDSIEKLSENQNNFTTICKINTKHSDKYLWCEISSSLIDTSGEIITIIHNITERLNILDELDRTIYLLSSAIESTADGMIISDKDGNILIHNKTFENMWDISGNYLSTHNRKAIFLKIISKIISDKKLKKQIFNIIQNSEEEFYEIIRLKKGSVIEVYSKPMKIGHNKIGRIWTFRDLTKRTEAEIALEHTYLQLKSLISAIPDMIYFKDPSNKFIFGNKSFFNWLGIEENQIIGKTDFELENYSQLKPLVKNDLAVLNSRQIKKEIIKYQYKNHPVKYLEIIKSPIINENKEINGLLCLIEDITTQKIANEALKESEERFRNIFETASEGICIIDANNKIILANKSFANMLGFPGANSLINNDIKDFIDSTWYYRHNEKIAILKQNQTSRSDFKFIKSDGSELWVLDSSSPLFDIKGNFIGYLSMLTDVTEKYQTIELLFKQKLLFESIALAANKLITIDEHKKAIIESMDIFSKTIGACKIRIFKIINHNEQHDLVEFIKWENDRLKCPNDLEKLYFEVISNENLINDLKNGQIILLNSKDSIFHNIGSEALLFYSPILIQEKLWGFTEYISIVIDEQILEQQKSLLITYNSSLISTIEQMILYETLNEAIEKAEAANKAKSLFLANISHEIRTPMTAIIGFAELLLSKSDNPHHTKYLNSILKSSNHLLALFNDILDLSKIEADKIEFIYKPFNLKKLILEIEQIFSQQIYEKNLVFIIDISDEFPEKIRLDEIRLRQILFNLVGNSVKFTDHGLIKIIVEPISTNNSTIDFMLSVQDTGIGIPASLQQNIFEAFNKKYSSGRQSISGSGLGLAITKKLVEKMNGTIQVQSDGISGTRFDIIFRKIEFIDKIKLTELRSYKRIDYDILTEKVIFIGSIDKIIKELFNEYEIITLEYSLTDNTFETINKISPKFVVIDFENLSHNESTAINRFLMKSQKHKLLILISSENENSKSKINKLNYENVTFIQKTKNIDQTIFEINKILKLDQVELSKIQNQIYLNELKELDKRSLKQFINKFENFILPHIKLLNSTLIIDDVYYIANELKELSSKYRISFLNQISIELAENAESYNVLKIKKQLKQIINIFDLIINFSMSEENEN